MRRRDFVKFFSSVPLVPLVLGKKQVGDMSGESKDGWLMVSTCLDVSCHKQCWFGCIGS